MLLIFPPVAKSCEPPAGIARLAGELAANGIPVTVFDANLEGQLYLLQSPVAPKDTWTRRAVKHVSSNLAALRDPRTYRSPDTYDRAVRDLQRVLAVASAQSSAVAGLADYQHQQLSPLRSADLIQAAATPEQNTFFPWFRTRLPLLIEQDGTGIVGISLNYLSQALTTFSMIGFIKRDFPGTRIVLGGGLVTSWMQQPEWKSPFSGLVEDMIAGPGEAKLLALLGTEKPREGGPFYNTLPLADYLAPGFILPYSASAGCWWNRCTFCPENAEGNPYVPVPADRAITELETLIAGTNPALVHLLDNAINPALLKRLVEQPLRVPWYGFARITRELADPEYCMALKRAGCAMLKLGLESGDQEVLDRLNKGIDLEIASRAFRNLKQAGIATYVYLLFGTPQETIDAARRTLDFVCRHHEAITFLNLAVFNLPKCSTDARQYEVATFYDGDLSLYADFRHPAGWGRKQVRSFLDNEFRRNPVVAPILKNDPAVFTSNHAALFAMNRSVSRPVR